MAKGEQEILERTTKIRAPITNMAKVKDTDDVQRSMKTRAISKTLCRTTRVRTQVGQHGKNITIWAEACKDIVIYDIAKQTEDKKLNSHVFAISQ